MKYKYITAFSVAIFYLVLLSVNVFNHSMSYPPGGGACNVCHTGIEYASCTQCHNDPAIADIVEDTTILDINQFPEDIGFIDENHPDLLWSQNSGIWADTRNFSRTFVHMMPSSNVIAGAPYRNAAVNGPYTVDYVQMQFLVNSTHIVSRARITDGLINQTGETDKFAIMWNIDSEGGILSNFIENGGNMQLDNGKVDMWYWDAGDVAPNGTGMATDMYIDETHYYDDGNDNQDVMVGAHHGRNFENPKEATYYGYWIYFARELTNDDPNDIQFEEGIPIQYAIAYWNGTGYQNHLSSWEHYIIIGDDFGALYHTETIAETITNDVTHTETTTIASGTTSSFIGITTIGGLLLLIPVVAIINKKNKQR